jgi:MFS superfamily sulfate permease-like transporter
MATLAAVIIVAVSDLIKIKTTIKIWKTEIQD